MVAAYVALMSLMHTSELILHPSQQWLRIPRNMIGSLLQKVRFLQEFLEDYSHRGDEEMAGLESQIADMAFAAEDVMESHVSDQSLARFTGSEARNSTRFSEYIHEVIEEMEDLIKNKLMRIKETVGKFEEDRTLIDFSPAVSSRLAPNEQNTLVGSDEKLIEMMERLTGQQSNRQTIAVVGMGGIGKTTLAKNVYEHPHIKHHFDIRSWATISQKYSARKIISELISNEGQSSAESLLSDYQLGQQSYESKVSVEQLGEKLYKSLCGTRYLIVMDDFWSTEAWDEIKQFFPDNRNGSRIMITMRLGNVAANLSSCRRFDMKFLDADRSWKLLSEKVFGRRDCPPELEELGKTIAKNCEGLPLAIVVIGGLLAKSNKTRESWRHVAENLNSIINSEDNEKCLKTLSLSYNNLPIHLKPCFLYLAMVHDIYIPSLVKEWVSKGFVKPIRGKSLEEAAYEYITDLFDRNLIFVRRRFLGKLRNCGMHDLLRDLCLRETEKINLCGVKDLQNPEKKKQRKGLRNRHIPSEVNFMRGIGFGQDPLKSNRSIQILRDLYLLEPESRSRSIIWSRSLENRISGSGFRLQSLFHVMDTSPKGPTVTILPNEILQLINLRFLHFNRNSISRFTSSISLFWNLQTLQCDDEPVFLPPEIWYLPHLRHLEFRRCVLPDPPCCDLERHDSHILENMQTLSRVLNFRCSEEVCRRLPNLKELRVYYEHLSPGVEWPFFRLHNLVHLHKLESLFFKTLSPISSKYLSFPVSLKMLHLRSCCLPWEDIAIVGSLPNLEILHLQHGFKGPTWCPVEGHFVKLKILQIGDTDLLHWRAHKTHFPVLEFLKLNDLNMEEFPRDFGEHPTLEKILLLHCSDSTKAWAEQVREEQESFENENFRVSVRNSANWSLRKWLRKSLYGG